MEGPLTDAAAALPSATTLQLLVSLPWGEGAGRRTRVLPVPVPVSPANMSIDEGTTTTAGALLAPLLREAKRAAGGRELPPLMATYHGKRCVHATRSSETACLDRRR